MKYVILMRKINVGKENRIGKNELAKLFVELGYNEVNVYINSGNVILNTQKSLSIIKNEIQKTLFTHFGEEIPFLIKSPAEMKAISEAIPEDWENNDEQKTDIAYLFDEIDNIDVMQKLPFKKEYVNIKYVKGALIWNVNRKNQGKSQMTKIVRQEIYQWMTIRNVNTARYLGNINGL